MKLKNIFIGMAMCSLFFTVSCQKEELTTDESVLNKKTTLIATLEVPAETRTELGESVDGRTPVLWSKGDMIGVIGENNFTASFTLAAGVGTSSASFTGILGSVDVTEGALYPHHIIAGRPLLEASPINLPEEQNYVVDNISAKANIAVAKADGDKLAFKNVCGILNVKLTGTATITRIVIKSENALSGKGFLNRTTADAVLTMATDETGKKQVVLNCGDGVLLTSEPTNFYIVVPPTTAESFTMEIVSSEGIMEHTTKVSAENVFTKGKIINMPVQEFVANTVVNINHSIYGATAKNVNGEDTYNEEDKIANSCDNMLNTRYHSNWYPEGGNELPITLGYNFVRSNTDPGVTLDYIVYHDQLIRNGNFGVVDIYLSTTTNDDEGFGEIFMTYDFKQTGGSIKVPFSEKQTGVKYIKFVVKTGYGNFVACQEMEFVEIREVAN